jgi:16S rRNA (cytosine1402-N4)-methyltransferase
VLSALQPSAGSRYIDGTVGAGGHATGILQNSEPDGQLLGIDRDQRAIELARNRLAMYRDRLYLTQGSFAQMGDLAQSIGWDSVSGILMDLGLSSMQLGDASRGFSFLLSGPLDMRFDQAQSLTAADLVNGLSQDELQELISTYGEEPRSRRVARALVQARPIHTTGELAEIVRRALGGSKKRVDPATRTFQALRMAVNRELPTLSRGLQVALDLLEIGGRLVVISFHSLEDRMVKQFFREQAKDCICSPDQPVCTCDHQARLEVLTKKPIRPDQAEILDNPRARSAKLRIAAKISMA